MKPKTLKEAIQTIKQWDCEDAYIQANYKQFMNGGEADDNTIDSSIYYRHCQAWVNNFAVKAFSTINKILK